MLAMRQGIWCPVVFPIAVSCVLVLCSMQIGLAAEKRVALIVGNSRYLHMNARSSARQDAADVAGAFEKLGSQATMSTGPALRRGYAISGPLSRAPT